MNNLTKRILTAALLIPLVLIILFLLSPSVFFMMVSLVALGGAWEWTNLMELKRPLYRCLYVGLILLTFFGALFVYIPYLFFFTLIWWFIAFVLVITYPRHRQLNKIIKGLMGIMVLAPCWVALNYMRHFPDGMYAILFLFVLIWGADSAAYFVGKKWGRTKLLPAVSPGKSVQGLIGALVFGMLFTLLSLLISQIPWHLWWGSLLLAFVTVLFSVNGDLFESMLKREIGIKDSGNLLPGHGGLLDRIDSLTAAAPIFAYGVILLGAYFG